MATAVTSLQLGSVLKEQSAAPLYLVLGEEGGFNYDLFYGDETSGARIVTCASEMPVFAERRLVIVKAADKLPAREGEALLGYLKDPVETTTLVFACQKLDGRLKFTQALARAA